MRIYQHPTSSQGKQSRDLLAVSSQLVTKGPVLVKTCFQPQGSLHITPSISLEPWQVRGHRCYLSHYLKMLYMRWLLLPIILLASTSE